LGSFSLDVSKFVAKANKNVEKVVRSVSIKLFSAIIKESPVKSGRFRANWQTTGTNPATGLIAGTDPTGGATINSATTFITNAPTARQFTLTNNLPYAAVIEYGGYPGDGPNTTGGYSKQAPQGVVRVNVMRFQSLINEEAAKVR